MRTLILIMSLISFSVFAGQFQDVTAEAQNFGNSQKGYVDNLARGTDTRADQYGGSSAVSADLHPCNQVNAQGQKTCGGQAIVPGENPQQYYGMSPAQLEDNARVKASTDENAQWMFDSHNARPAFDIRRDDQLFKHQEANQNNMVNLSDSYQGCKDIAYGGVVTTSEDKSCIKTGTPTYLSTTCERTLTASCSNADAGTPWYYAPTDFTVRGGGLSIGSSGYDLSFSASRGQYCPGYDSYIDFNIDSLANIETWNLTGTTWDDAFSVSVNGTVIWQADGSVWGADPHRSVPLGRGVGDRCEWGAVFGRNETKDIKPYLKVGTNTIRIHHQVGGSGYIQLRATAKRYRGCNVQDTITEACPNGFDRSKAWKTATTCRVPGSTIYLGRTAVTRDCWGWTDTWNYEGQPLYQEDSTCQALRDQGCSPNGSVCNVTSPSGWCKEARMNFTCSASAPEKTMQVCGDTLVCAGGDCYDKPPAADSTPDFLKAASYLAAMEDMKKEFDPNNATVWKGQFRECSVNATLIGSDQCCTGGSGTINTLGKTCNTVETEINLARENKRVSFIRNWTECTQRVGNACVNKLEHYEFCIWPSKLARIVQDQGRPMLGQQVANPCPGFKLQNPNEFEGIDWSRIDLSDYFSDVTAKYNATAKPSPDALTNQMQQSNGAMQDEYNQKMQQYYGQ